MIVLALDFTSTQSLLALGPATLVARETGVELQLLPFEVQPNPVPAQSEPESVAERHFRLRSEYKRSDEDRYAKLQGFTHLVRPTGVDPRLAHLSLLIANDFGVGTEFAHHVFRGLWSGQLRIEDERVVLKTLGDVGVTDPPNLAGSVERLEAIRQDLVNQEVDTVPTFLVNGERFVGREHLPMIRWMLQGGEVPLSSRKLERLAERYRLVKSPVGQELEGGRR